MGEPARTRTRVSGPLDDDVGGDRAYREGRAVVVFDGESSDDDDEAPTTAPRGGASPKKGAFEEEKEPFFDRRPRNADALRRSRLAAALAAPRADLAALFREAAAGQAAARWDGGQ